MPYIHASISEKLSDQQNSDLKSELGRIIGILPGKSESVLMLRIDDNCRMSFRGEEGECAFLAVHLYRNSPEAEKKKFASEAVSQICRITGLDKDRVFMTLQEHGSWVASGDML